MWTLWRQFCSMFLSLIFNFVPSFLWDFKYFEASLFWHDNLPSSFSFHFKNFNRLIKPNQFTCFLGVVFRGHITGAFNVEQFYHVRPFIFDVILRQFWDNFRHSFRDIVRITSGFFQDIFVLRINYLYLIGGSVGLSSQQFSTEIVGGQNKKFFPPLLKCFK